MLDGQIDDAVTAHEAALVRLWQLIRQVKRNQALSVSERERLLSKLYSPLSTKDIKEHFVSDGHRYSIGVSFRSSMRHMMHIKSSLTQRGLKISPGGNPKLKDRAFARQLGVPTPKTRQSRVPFSEVRTIPRSVIKPVHGAGARNVFYVHEDQTLTSIKSGRRYSTLTAAREEILQGNTLLRQDSWIVEEAVLGPGGQPANDLKVYMFYGQVGIFLELKRNTDETNTIHYRAHNADGDPIPLGPRYTAFQGSGIPADVLEKARKLSLACPVPFLRFDFHIGAEECYLGEITPHPGGTYAGDLYDGLDKHMGQLFLDAEARLYRDMLEGKRFTDYFRVYS